MMNYPAHKNFQIQNVFFSITLTLTFLLSGLSSTEVFATQPPSISPQLILHYINEHRAKRHLPPLKLVPSISAEAVQHSQDMAKHTLPFGHQRFEDRMKRLYAAMRNCKAGAENVAYYKTNAKKLVDAWVTSPGHRRNIEGHYNLTGIGIAYGKKGWAYYTQIFLRTG
jgi:uncharacterized protein YkwD